MRQTGLGLFAVAAALLVAPPADSRPQQPQVDALTYADLADLSLAAPVAAHVRVTRAIRLDVEEAVGVPDGKTRFYVEADVVTLIRGAGGIPSEVSYLVDLPNDASGRRAKLRRKSEHLLFANTVPARPGELRLAAPDAQIAWSAEREQIVRRILNEAASPDAPPQLVGIGNAFSVPGTLPGESETQIFFQTASGAPVSLTILRRPNEEPRWAVALSEIVDNAARPPEPESLLWYRLACTLPPTLPSESFDDADPARINEIQRDYRFVLERLGPCVRSRR